MNAKEAALVLGASHKSVLRWIMNGQLPAIRIKRRAWDITPQAIEQFKRPKRRLPADFHFGRPGTPEHMLRISHLGGQSAVDRGTDFKELGSHGGRKTVVSRGAEHMRSIGSKGGSNSRGVLKPRKKG